MEDPRKVVTSLVSSIPVHQASRVEEREGGERLPTLLPLLLRESTARTKHIFLTLQVLYPNELLPALDLLDRGLVTWLHCPSAAADSQLLLVRSAQRQRQHHHSSRSNATLLEHASCYEVRLDAWSCSCPAFAFAAFPAADEDESPSSSQDHVSSLLDPVNGDWIFGGLSRGIGMPACKHLLACVLAQHCPLFEHCVIEQVCSNEELAAWAAGWSE